MNTTTSTSEISGSVFGSKKNNKKATSSIVYHSIKDDILHLQLPPGSAISEIETAAKYNVSRTPVRDAFKALASEELLVVRPHIGTFVSYIDMNKVSDMIFIREVMEKAVLKIFANSYTQAQILKVRLALKEQENLLASRESLSAEEIPKTGTRFLRLDNDFHLLLFELAGKGPIWNQMISNANHYERFRTLINWGEKNMLDELYQQHCDLIEAIVTKDLVRLPQIVSNHIYSGFAGNADIVLRNADYFVPESTQ